MSCGVFQIRVRTSQRNAGFFERAGFVATEVAVKGFAPGIDEVTMLLRGPTGSQE